MAVRLRMTRTTYVLLAALAGVLLWTRAMDSRVKQLRAQAAQASQTAATAPAPAPAVGGAPSEAALASVRAEPWGEDPFWQTAPAAPGAHAHRRAAWKPTGTGLSLKGILWSGSESTSSAQICDEVVRVGEVAYRWKVLKITPETVTLEDRGAVITLRLNEDKP